METTFVSWTVRATAVFSYGRCASLCAWWLGPWSWSGHPELHRAVPAPSLPPGQGSSAASASAQTHTQSNNYALVETRTLICLSNYTTAPSEHEQLRSKTQIKEE